MTRAALTRIIAVYFAELEQKTTSEVCKCAWSDSVIPGRTKIKVRENTDPTCAIHSREGLVFSFIETTFPGMLND